MAEEKLVQFFESLSVIVCHALVVRDAAGWQITAAGRSLLALIEAPASTVQEPARSSRRYPCRLPLSRLLRWSWFTSVDLGAGVVPSIDPRRRARLRSSSSRSTGLASVDQIASHRPGHGQADAQRTPRGILPSCRRRSCADRQRGSCRCPQAAFYQANGYPRWFVSMKQPPKACQKHP